MEDCKEAGVDGFIIVDLPPEEAGRLRQMVLRNLTKGFQARTLIHSFNNSNYF